jgi:pimeloyl-ACP methyl ester carboxylesterase
VVRHSLGSIVAIYLATTYRDRVRDVVFLGPINLDLAMVPFFGQRIQVVKDGNLTFDFIRFNSLKQLLVLGNRQYPE